MAKGIRYTDEFKQEAVNQITKHSYDVADVLQRQVEQFHHRFIVWK